MRRAWVVFVLLLCLYLSSYAQSDRASITGRVTDSSGAVMPGVTVKITNLATNAEFEAVTNEEGRYVTAAIFRPGQYKVSASIKGFKTAVEESVTLQVGAVREVNIQMEVGAEASTITVTAQTEQIETETSSRGEVITGRQVTELPLKDRNFTQLATLTPGVHRVFVGNLTDQTAFNQGDPNAGSVPGGSNAVGSSEAARFSRSGGASISANGLRPSSTNYSLDGVDNNEPQFGTIGVFPNPDAIAEFKVETSLAKAEVGRGGASINTTFQSGTNNLRGSVYYYGQNEALNATHWVINRNRTNDVAGGQTPAQAEASRPKSGARVHEFGGTLGGPIIRNRTFIFGDYLGQRNHFPVPFQTAVPTAESRVGNFSAAFWNPIPDPATCTIPGQPASGGCTNFAGNIIPMGQMISQGLAFLATYPQPNATPPNATTRPSFSNPNYLGVRDNQETIDSFNIKADHRLTDNNNLMGRFSFSNQLRTRDNFFPGLPTAGFGAGEEVGDTRQIVVSDTHVFRPTMLNEFRFGWTQIEIGIFNCGVGGACGADPDFSNTIGIPNSNKGTLATTGSILTGGFGNGEFEFLGDGGLFLVKSNNFYIADSVTIISGKHTWKTGIEIRPRRLETIDGGRSGGLKGHIQYGDCCHPFTTGNIQADYLLGQPALDTFSGSIIGGERPFELHKSEWSFFVQDDWKVTPTLILNLGLRYDIFAGFSEKDGRFANFDVQNRTVVRAADSGDRLVDTDYSDFGPRLGFAWNFGPERKFVLRGGYGIFYTQDGVDYPPLIRNVPITSSVRLGAFTGNQGNFNLQTGPPVAPIIDPPVISTGTQLFTVETDAKTASVQEWSLSVQWEFVRNWLFDIGYVATRSRNLLATRDLGNGSNGLGLALTPTAAQDPNPVTNPTPNMPIGGLVAFENRASANYDALQMRMEKRFSHGFEMRSAYTWSHNIDESTGVFQSIGDLRGSSGGPINPLDFRRDRSSSSLDRRHLFTTNLIWDLPFGQGRRLASNVDSGWNKVIGGWQSNIVWSAQTGQPFNIEADSSSGRTRPDVVSGCDPLGGLAPGRFVNVACFVTPTQTVTNLAGKTIFFGTLGRNAFRGPGFFRTDLSLFKNTNFGEEGRYKVQFGIEFFNMFNQVHHVVPNNFIDNRHPGNPGGGSPACDRLITTDMPDQFNPANCPFGRFDNALAPRQIQYRLKVFF